MRRLGGVVVVVVAGLWLAGRVVAAPMEEEAARSNKDLPTRAEAEAAFKEGLRYEENGRYVKALEAYKRGFNPHAYSPPGLPSHMAACYAALHDYPKAISYYKEALRKDPSLVEERFRLATVYLETGELAYAQAEYDELVALDATKGEELKRLIEERGGLLPSVDSAKPEPSSESPAEEEDVPEAEKP